MFIFELELFSLNRRIVVFLMFFDWITLIFISFVLLISSLVIYYSKDYILGDLNINRFILLVLLFVFSIIMLIIRPNLIRILLG
jgi:NADH-ubiquinone oxidoreductase chain 5